MFKIKISKKYLKYIRILKYIMFSLLVYFLFLRDDQAFYRYFFIVFYSFCIYVVFCGDLKNKLIKIGRLEYQLMQIIDIQSPSNSDLEKKEKLSNDWTYLNKEVNDCIRLGIILWLLLLAFSLGIPHF